MKPVCQCLLGLVFILLFSLPALAELYMWTDENGIRHFSNITPPTDADRVLKTREGLSKTLPAGAGTFRVLKIYDGDTILVKGRDLTLKIRLAGIDAPETGGRKKQGQPFADDAKKFLSRLSAGRSVTMKSYGLGGYNRILAEVFTGSVNINMELVKNGMAEVYQGRLPDSFPAAAYLKAQQAAKSRGLGIWSLGRQYKSPRQWRRENPRQ